MNRQPHRQEVHAFLQKHFGITYWDFAIPNGSGNETYFVNGNEQRYFIKVGVQIERYQAMDALGLIPPVLLTGYLTDGVSIIVQAYIAGRTPSRKDFQTQLEQIATMISRTHHGAEVKRVLPEASSNTYRDLGLAVLTGIQQRWEAYQAQVPEVAEFVEASLADLHQQVQSFQGAGLVASHNDICNANWLLSTDGQLYLLDLESMTRDDPAVDIGAMLWWYYPPELRSRFLAIAKNLDRNSGG